MTESLVTSANRIDFVRDTRGTGIKRLSIHSDDGLNTNL